MLLSLGENVVVDGVENKIIDGLNFGTFFVRRLGFTGSILIVWVLRHARAFLSR